MSRTENMQISVEVMFILGSSLFVGCIAGVYIYFVSGLGNPGEADVPERFEPVAFEIVADAYGGCQMSGLCPSYRVTETGQYTYIVPIERSGDVRRYEGRLSTEDQQILTRNLTIQNLERKLETSFSGTCPAAYDGAAYQFVITLDDTLYEFDSCRQDLVSDPGFQSLINLFTQFAQTAN